MESFWHKTIYIHSTFNFWRHAPVNILTLQVQVLTLNVDWVLGTPSFAER
jgi:hypothetical protein